MTSLPGFAAVLFLHGRVIREDGSPLNGTATIEKVCSDRVNPQRVTTTDSKGEYSIHIEVLDQSFEEACVLRASAKGYQSTTIEFVDWRLFQDPDLPPIRLMRQTSDRTVDVFEQDRVPLHATRAWSNAGKAASAGRWAEAEKSLRAVTQAAPKFAQGWYALAAVLSNERKIPEAREAGERAVELNPKLLSAEVLLARLDLELKDWEAARKAADEVIRLDGKHRYVEAYIQQATARFQLKDVKGAEASIQEAIRLDTKHDFPRAEYVLGRILEARHEIEAAREHMQEYLELEPKAFDAAEVRARIDHVGAAAQTDDIASELERVAGGLQLAASSDAWVPGGLEALAKAAGVPGELSYQNFFIEFCRALVREASPRMTTGVPHYRERLLNYFASIAQLGRMGKRDGDTIVVTLSLKSPEERTSAARALELLGWRLKSGNVAEPGDEPADGLRQVIPGMLGVDELWMQQTLSQGQSFELRIPTQNARLIGGEAWSRLVKDLPSYPGGIAEAFARDPRLAKVYAGLGEMGAESASAVVASAGFPALMDRYADVLSKYPDVFVWSKDGAAVPGNPEAWAKLAGASPQTAPAFFHALLDRDSGSLAAFYSVLAHADAAHQRFFTATPARAERFYAWYRDSQEPRWSAVVAEPRWRAELLRELPLDSAGVVRFPGGRAAWTDAAGADDEVLLKIARLESLVRVARIEERRRSPLDEASARLLAANQSQWSALFPYFENLPGLEAGEFRALQSFTEAVAGFPPVQKRAVLGEWDALVELIARDAKAGSLDAERSARAFREACERLVLPDHAARSLTLLHEIGGIEALRLTPEEHARFQRIAALLHVPEPDTAKSGDAAAVLTGMVYAAALNSDGLLVNMDPGLIAKHRFAGNGNELFPPTKLVRSSSPPGSYLSGTFVNVDEIARGMTRAGEPARAAEAIAALSSVPTGDGEEHVQADFRAEGRLVEVYATVTDSRGHYIDDLTREQFSVVDSGIERSLAGFESRSTELSVALLLDTTGSMVEALPALKVAALKLIGELRAEDQIAVYSFNEKVSELVPFTADKDAAKRAVLHTEPFGETALYDALARVNRDLAARTGKKVIVVFTDGDDNASTLTSDAAIERAKAAGVPVYTIAQGGALMNPEYLRLLSGVSAATGGASYAVRNAAEIHNVFEKIAEDLMHTYFFAFRPEGAEGHQYRPIEVKVTGGKNYKMRAREGYYPE